MPAHRPRLKNSQPLARAALPSEAELRAFASAAAQLLIERQPRTAGSRTVSRRAGVGLQHLDHRDYMPGDEVRHIDWRQTARRRQPIVRRFEAESMSDWTLVLDASSSMVVQGEAGSQAPSPTKWQAAVQMAAALSYALLHLGHRVGLLIFGARVRAECPRGRGPHHYAAIARLLTTQQPPAAAEGSELGACAAYLHGAASVFALSDFLADDEMCRGLSALLQRCASLHAVQLRQAAETRLQLAGEFDLVDVETGARAQVHSGAAADALASAERAAMTARLRSYCARSGVAFSDWDIATPWQHMLLRHLVRARFRC